MIDRRQGRAEHLAVRHHATDGDAAEANAVIATHATDQALTRALAADIVIGDGDLERRIDRFRAGIGEEHVIEIAGRHGRDAGRQLESLRIAKLNGGEKSISAA